MLTAFEQGADEEACKQQARYRTDDGTEEPLLCEHACQTAKYSTKQIEIIVDVFSSGMFFDVFFHINVRFNQLGFASKFTNNLYAPGTPAGNCLKKARDV